MQQKAYAICDQQPEMLCICAHCTMHKIISSCTQHCGCNISHIHGHTAHKNIATSTIESWNKRSDHDSWYARRIREGLISKVKQSSERGIIYIKTLVAAAPLLGLLGTVTGMVEVFDVMAITGSSNARAMAAGISKATLPTMAGMVTSLSGIFFIAQIETKSRKAIANVEDELPLS